MLEPDLEALPGGELAPGAAGGVLSGLFDGTPAAGGAGGSPSDGVLVTGAAGGSRRGDFPRDEEGST